jgi:ketosteroid isomerase-like protein
MGGELREKGCQLTSRRKQIGSVKKMLTQAEAETFASEWIEAWNSHDLDRILAHYSEDFEFSSPFVVRIAGEPSGRLRGKKLVGAYWAKALARIHELRFKRGSVLWGVNSIVINYERQDGRLASEWFELGENGKVIRSAAHYLS